MLRRLFSRNGPIEPSPAGEEGAVALEFVLVAPLFLVLVFGIIVYGLYFTVWIGATEAASEGARASVAGLSQGESAGYATSSANSVITAYGPLMSGCKPNATSTTAGDGSPATQVTVTCDLSNLGLGNFATLLPVPGNQVSATVIVANGG